MSFEYIRQLNERGGVDEIGGKADNLRRVRDLEVPIPKTVVIVRRALELMLEREVLGVHVEEHLREAATLDSESLNRSHQMLAKRVREQGLPLSVGRDLERFWKSAADQAPFGFAVRSSAIYEDSHEASFAGVFESWVGVMDLKDLAARVLNCWIATWSPRAIRYMHKMGVEPVADGMAVIIQPVIPATKSGVIYTANPNTGNPWEFVISATEGLSVDLMSGAGEGERIVVDWLNGTLIERDHSRPSSRWVASSAGVCVEALETSPSDSPTLGQSEIQSLLEVARHLDEGFGYRLDIEFVIVEGEVTVVQARPMTALPPFFHWKLPAAESEKSWQRLDYVIPLRSDAPAGLLTPIYNGCSDAEMWQRYQPSDITLGLFCRETVDVGGYRYSRLESLPSFADFFDDVLDYEPWLDRNEERYRQRWDQHQESLADIIGLAQEALRKTRTASQLIPLYFEMQDRLWDLNSFGWSGPQFLGWMCDQLLTSVVKEFLPDFAAATVSGGERSFTYESTLGLQQLGLSIEEESIRSLLDQTELSLVVPELLAQHPDSEFLQKLEAYCWQFGKVPPSWLDRPSFWSHGGNDPTVIHTVKSAMQGMSRDVVQLREQSLDKSKTAEERVRECIGRKIAGPLRQFDKLLDWYRYWSQALNDRHSLGAGLLWDKEMVWHLGCRLVDESILKRPPDVLALRREDLLSFAENPNGLDFPRLASERLREFQCAARLSAPKMIGKEADTPPASSEEKTKATPETVEEGVLSGVGIGTRVAEGEARWVESLTDPALLDSLSQSDILVLSGDSDFHYADWHSLLTIVGGVVAAGQPSHHLAQVARECGTPIIGNVGTAMKNLPDRATIELDPRHGRVRVLS